MHLRQMASALCLGWLAASAVQAQGTGETWQVAGFATLSAYRADDAAVSYRPSTQIKQASQGGEWRWDGDTTLAGQLRWQPSEQLELVWQARAWDSAAQRYRPQTDWLYLGWNLAPAWSLRLGRQTLPTFLISEYGSVGFSQTTVRPIAAVYALNPNSPVDGANLSWSGPAWDGTLSLDLGSGGARLRFSTAQIHLKSSSTAVAKWQRENLTLRLGVSNYHIDIQGSALDGQVAALSQAGSGCLNCAQVLPEAARSSDVKGTLTNLAMVWQPGSWTLTAEALLRRGNSSLTGDAWGAYMLVSKRIGPVTPYAAVGFTKYLQASPGLLAAPTTSPAFQQALATFDRALQAPFDRRQTVLGLRFDITDRMSAKIQHDLLLATRDTRTPRNADLTLGALPPGTSWDGRVGLLTASLDLVF